MLLIKKEFEDLQKKQTYIYLYIKKNVPGIVRCNWNTRPYWIGQS